MGELHTWKERLSSIATSERPNACLISSEDGIDVGDVREMMRVMADASGWFLARLKAEEERALLSIEIAAARDTIATIKRDHDLGESSLSGLSWAKLEHFRYRFPLSNPPSIPK